MIITQARREHIDAILEILEHARSIMRETGNLTQWANGYPSRDAIAHDIASGHGFLCQDESGPTGYFCLIIGDSPDPNYSAIERGNWLDESPYGVIHRLASNGRAKGVAQAAFDFAFSKIDNVRVDTHRDNLPMQRFLQKNGFVYCGVIYVSDGTPRDAFQKKTHKIIARG